MPYVQRQGGVIVGLYANPQEGYAEEWLDGSDPEVLAFKNPAPSLVNHENAIQNVVDAAPKDKLFRDGVTLASYTSSTNPQWAAEAQAFVAWRDAVWAYSYSELAKVQAGLREQPTVDEFLAELPAIVWPE